MRGTRYCVADFPEFPFSLFPPPFFPPGSINRPEKFLHRRRRCRGSNAIAANLIFRNSACTPRPRVAAPMLVSFYWRRAGNYIVSRMAIAEFREEMYRGLFIRRAERRGAF